MGLAAPLGFVAQTTSGFGPCVRPVPQHSCNNLQKRVRHSPPRMNRLDEFLEGPRATTIPVSIASSHPEISAHKLPRQSLHNAQGSVQAAAALFAAARPLRLSCRDRDGGTQPSPGSMPAESSSQALRASARRSAMFVGQKTRLFVAGESFSSAPQLQSSVTLSAYACSPAISRQSTEGLPLQWFAGPVLANQHR